MIITPADVAARLRQEFANAVISVIIHDDKAGTAEIDVDCEEGEYHQVTKRCGELSQKAQTFNMHADVGHFSRKTNWWKRV